LAQILDACHRVWHAPDYGILPEALREELARTAERLDKSEAELIRQRSKRHLSAVTPPSPRLPLFSSG
jgi:hypothetical protein